MKCFGTTTTLVLAALTLIVPAQAEITSRSTFRVERGDSYINLFGPDWQKAYQENKMTVIHAGRPITSPDILIEGSVVTVSSDVNLRPRALARLATLQRRREQLKARLTLLTPKLVNLPSIEDAVVQCRERLSNDLRFASDVDFAEREVIHLERLASGSILLKKQGQVPFALGCVVALCVMLTCLAVARLVHRRRFGYPEGSLRYDNALREVTIAFDNARLKT